MSTVLEAIRSHATAVVDAVRSAKPKSEKEIRDYWQAKIAEVNAEHSRLETEIQEAIAGNVPNLPGIVAQKRNRQSVLEPMIYQHTYNMNQELSHRFISDDELTDRFLLRGLGAGKSALTEQVTSQNRGSLRAHEKNLIHNLEIDRKSSAPNKAAISESEIALEKLRREEIAPRERALAILTKQSAELDARLGQY